MAKYRIAPEDDGRPVFAETLTEVAELTGLVERDIAWCLEEYGEAAYCSDGIWWTITEIEGGTDVYA